jgi:glycosyltransferase involved in cell wall biosynthesis
MNLLVDFSQIPIQKVGVGVYGLNLISNLEPDATSRYYVLVQDDDNSLDACESNGIILIRISSKKCRRLVNRLLLEQVYIPYLVYKYKIDVIHSLHYSFPVMTRARRIVTVCDMIFFKYPELHLRAKVFYFRFFIWLTTYLADKVICISKSTERDYLDFFRVKPNLTTVIELGVDQAYSPNIDRSEISALLEKYGIDGEYILFIGTIEPRKNITNLILAFAKLVKNESPLRLVIVGKKGWHYESVFSLVSELRLVDKVIFTGFVEESEKPALLVGARMFVYPSFYEGFGIPVLEALACGVPTITSNLSSMPEVAGDAAILVDPSNVEDIHAALAKLYCDEALSAVLRERALIQSSKFSWNVMAEKTVEVYKAVLSEADHPKVG